MKFVRTECFRDFTDNVADPDTLVESIVDAAQRLDRSGVRPDMFGIQFAQMGTEEVTNTTLGILGDNFGARNNVRVCCQLALFCTELANALWCRRLLPLSLSTRLKAHSTLVS